MSEKGQGPLGLIVILVIAVGIIALFINMVKSIGAPPTITVAQANQMNLLQVQGKDLEEDEQVAEINKTQAEAFKLIGQGNLANGQATAVVANSPQGVVNIYNQGKSEGSIPLPALMVMILAALFVGGGMIMMIKR